MATDCFALPSAVAPWLRPATATRPNRNLTARPGQTLTYDAENRLTQVISGTATTLLTYDGDGNLVKKVAPEGTTLYIGSHYEVFASANLPPPPPTPTPRPGLTHKFALPVVLGGCGYYVDGHLVPATKHYLFNGWRCARGAGAP